MRIAGKLWIEPNNNSVNHLRLLRLLSPHAHCITVLSWQRTYKPHPWKVWEESKPRCKILQELTEKMDKWRATEKQEQERAKQQQMLAANENKCAENNWKLSKRQKLWNVNTYSDNIMQKPQLCNIGLNLHQKLIFPQNLPLALIRWLTKHLGLRLLTYRCQRDVLRPRNISIFVNRHIRQCQRSSPCSLLGNRRILKRERSTGMKKHLRYKLPGSDHLYGVVAPSCGTAGPAFSHGVVQL